MINLPDSGEMWKQDKILRFKSNPVAANEEKRIDMLDKKLLEKRRNQRILKNTAME